MQRKFYVVSADSPVVKTILATEKLQKAALRKLKELVKRFGATRLQMVNGTPTEFYFGGDADIPKSGGALRKRNKGTQNWVPNVKSPAGRDLLKEMQAITYPDCTAVREALGLPYWTLGLCAVEIHWAIGESGTIYVTLPYTLKATKDLNRVADVVVEGLTVHKKLLGED